MSLKQLSPADLTDTLENTKRDTSVSLNAVQIGIIEAFDSSNQTATIRIAIKQVIDIAPDGTRTLKEHPLILECPVVTLFGGDSFINLPIQTGDNCLVFFCDREIDNWLNKGGVQAPTIGRTHDVSDAIALVGIRNFQNSIADFLANGIRISFTANSRIDLTDDAIDSIAGLFTHTGDMLIKGDLTVEEDVEIQGSLQVDGTVTGTGGTGAFKMAVDIDLNGNEISGGVVNSSNGATGSFDNVTVVDGIVTGGT